MAATVAVVVAALYLLPGVALVQLCWRKIDRDAGDSGHYWRAIAALVLLWPKALYDSHRDTR